MIFFLALIPATMLTMVGYAVIYLANRSEGGFKAFGKYLGFWAFTLAVLMLLGSLICATHCGGRMHAMMMHGHGGEMQEWQQPPPPQEPPPGATPTVPAAPK